jgi:hypothetical protein
MGLFPLICAEAPRITPIVVSYSTIPMPVTDAAAETNRSETAALPAGRFRTKSMRMMLNTRDTPKTPNSTPMPISSTSATPTRPGQIMSTTERAFCRSAPALLEAATLPAVQATALDRIFRTKSIERMMLNTRDTPKTPNSTPMPVSFTSAAPTRQGQITSTKGSREPVLLLPKKPPAERAFGCSAPALLEAATLPAVQATALDRIFRTKSIERMMLNTRDTPKTPNSTPMPVSFTSAAPTRPGQITSTKGSREPVLLLPKKPPAERAFGCAVQITALDRMVANTRKTPERLFFKDYY